MELDCGSMIESDRKARDSAWYITEGLEKEYLWFKKKNQQLESLFKWHCEKA